MTNPGLIRSRTRSPSPGRIFASSTTPIVVPSSPLLQSPSSILKSILKDPIGTKTCNANDDASSCDTPIRRSALNTSPGRENLPLKSSRTQRNIEKIGGKLYKEILGKAADHLDSSEKKPKRKSGSQKTKSGDKSVNKTLIGHATKPLATRISKPVKGLHTLPDDGVPTLCDDSNLTKAPCDDDQFDSQAAIKRRCGWTPVKNTAVLTVDLTLDSVSSTPDSCSKNNRPFTSLLSGYGFIPGSTSNTNSESSEINPTKKRQLELFPALSTTLPLEADSGQCALTEKSIKPKRARKPTSTTITSLSTASYERYNSLPSSRNPEFLPVNPPDPLVKCSNHESRATKPRVKRTKGKKKIDNSIFKVAPAVDALKSLEDQVFVFGTSSQLERSSPDEASYIKNCKQDMHLSESSTGSISTLSRFKASKNLWSAGGKTPDMELSDIEVVDMADSNTPRLIKSATLPPCRVSTQTASCDNIAKDISLPPQERSATAKSVIQEIPETPTGKFCSKIVQHPTNSSIHAANSKQMPSFRGFTTAELTQKVAAFGFRPLKNRDKMISLLEKCWETQNKTHTPLPMSDVKVSDSILNIQGRIVSDPPQERPATLKTVAPKKQVPKHKADKLTGISPNRKKIGTNNSNANQSQIQRQAPSQPVIVIPDSDCSDIEYGRSNSYDTLTSHSSLNNTHPLSLDLNQQITKAIRAQPRIPAINGVKQPTWLEKILMYDPIWLEDFTVWLNTEGLNCIGEDREVGVFAVREWCEGKGICCTLKRSS
ncbi:5'-flap endonuclease [Ophidiomyces ophidiicola]|nr:5'-flap endonuclease [Ophidiomyces ophidiicola]KAI1988212.1 5'-flap endonuclease [Ophidiomyces ophidiicola]KAI1988721.1 5'-flap endonuclease [Ophidiomyces ophidiicola]